MADKIAFACFSERRLAVCWLPSRFSSLTSHPLMDLSRFVAPFDPPTTTLVDSLRYWTKIQPDELCYTFTDGEDTETTLTYRQFDQRARAVAAKLTEL